MVGKHCFEPKKTNRKTPCKRSVQNERDFVPFATVRWNRSPTLYDGGSVMVSPQKLGG